MIISRFLGSQSTAVSKLSSRSLYRTGRLLSAGPDNVQESVKVEEAETINMPPPPTEKAEVDLLVHMCGKEALGRGLSVCSLNRSGKTSVRGAWADNMTWFKGDLLVPDSLKDAFDGVTAVVSCVGGFGSNSHMYKINGTANVNAIRAASEHGVKRFVYISAADFSLVNFLLRGYYEGKKAAEAELLAKFPYGGVILRPGFIHGTRQVGGMKLPLGIIGSPMEMILQHAKPLSQLPLVGPVFLPPVSVISVAKVAVRGATDPAFPPGVVDVFSILRYGQ